MIDEHTIDEKILGTLAKLGPDLVKKGMRTFEGEDGLEPFQGFGTCIVARMYGEPGELLRSHKYMEMNLALDRPDIPEFDLDRLSGMHHMSPRRVYDLCIQYLAGVEHV